jgi:selenocysteine-specific elongation factor
VHHGTREAPARVVPIDDLWQLRCEAPLVVASGDRLVLRRLAPPDTIGGGVVVDAPAREKSPPTRPERRRSPAATQPSEDALRMARMLRDDGERPRSDAQLAAAAGLDTSTAAQQLRLLERSGRVVRVGRDLHFHPDGFSGSRPEWWPCASVRAA